MHTALITRLTEYKMLITEVYSNPVTDKYHTSAHTLYLHMYPFYETWQCKGAGDS